MPAGMAVVINETKYELVAFFELTFRIRIGKLRYLNLSNKFNEKSE